VSRYPTDDESRARQWRLWKIMRALERGSIAYSPAREVVDARGNVHVVPAFSAAEALLLVARPDLLVDDDHLGEVARRLLAESLAAVRTPEAVAA
jgi:hypothetical protein